MPKNPYLTAITALNKSGIRYVIVGGFAVVMHGVNRFTPDLNVAVDLESERLAAALESLAQDELRPALDVSPQAFVDPASREELFQGGKNWFFSLRDVQAPSFSLDLFLNQPYPFEELYQHAEIRTLKGESAWIASRDHLISMKLATSRGQDKSDVQHLRVVSGIDEDIDVGIKKGILEFARSTDDEKLDWLLEMLTQLGQFCVL